MRLTTVRDDASILGRITIEHQDYDLAVVTTSSYAYRDGFNYFVEQQLPGPSGVVIGIDPVHRWTQIKAGPGL